MKENGNIKTLMEKESKKITKEYMKETLILGKNKVKVFLHGLMDLCTKEHLWKAFFMERVSSKTLLKIIPIRESLNLDKKKAKVYRSLETKFILDSSIREEDVAKGC